MPILLLALAACAAPKPPESPGFRRAGTPIYSNAVFDAARLEGDWVQVAGFGAGCRPGGASFAAGQVRTKLCLGGREQAFAGAFAVTGPGRLALRGAAPDGIGAPWWVIWVDTDYRTLAIGTPDGSFGFLLNRGGPLPADRLTAAREIFEWNGYDLSRLTVY